MSDVFFTADEHYGHERVIGFCKRPHTDARDGIEKIIAAHNAKVHRGSITYHIGDMFWRSLTEGQCIDIINRLNGQHAFIWGNHDDRMEASLALQSKFVFVRHVAQIDAKVNNVKQKIWLSHYAHRVWPSSHKTSWHLYGHSHAALPEVSNRSFDVGVDTRPDYAPWSLEEIAAKMKAKEAAGAQDPMAAQIAKQPWNKAEGAEIAYPAFTDEPQIEVLPMPEIPSSVWEALKEASEIFERASGANFNVNQSIRRCVE